MAAPVYRFLPWSRSGLAQAVANPDTEGELPARTSIQVDLDVAGQAARSRVELYGPGEVTGIDRRLVLRTEPAPGVTDFEPNYLAAIEFDPPDFPWLFTPARHRNGRLRPWCVLAVVERSPGVTLSVRADAPLPVLRIASPADPAQELPDLSESWAWAHAQTLEETGTTPDSDPDRSLSRLVCPRRLAAFVVSRFATRPVAARARDAAEVEKLVPVRGAARRAASPGRLAAAGGRGPRAGHRDPAADEP